MNCNLCPCVKICTVNKTSEGEWYGSVFFYYSRASLPEECPLYKLLKAENKVQF